MPRSPILPLAMALLTTLAGQAQTVERLLAEGDSLLAQQRFSKAVEVYTRAITQHPSATTYTARARAWYAMDRTDRFLQDVEQALKADSTFAEANYQRSLYALRGEDHRSAERFSDRGLRNGAVGRLRAQLLLVHGEALAELRRPELAIADLRDGLVQIPDDLDANRTLARMLDETGDHEGALVVLERLCALEPRNPGHWTNRGFELSRLGRWTDALGMFEQALDIDKDEPVALSNRAYALLHLDRNEEAWKDVERSLRYYPANAFALRTRALLRLRKGDLEKACADLSLARILGGISDVDALIQEHCATVPGRR